MIAFVAAAASAALCVADPAPPLPFGGDHTPAAHAVGAARLTKPVADTALRRMFDGGATIDDFLTAAKQRKEQWQRNYTEGAVPDALLTRARAAGGPWKLLVVAVDGCSDSVNTVPYIAKLVTQLMGAELRIVHSDVGKSVMEAHRTPDGRAATPTVVLLDADYNERGCWIERPTELRDWMIANKGKGRDNSLFEHKMTWYDQDKGAKTLEDIVAMMEAAASGSPRC